MKIETIAERAASYGIPGERIDGNDVLAVNDAATRAIERARRGEGPTLLELMTCIAGHSRSDACEYRPDEEEALVRARSHQAVPQPAGRDQNCDRGRVGCDRCEHRRTRRQGS